MDKLNELLNAQILPDELNYSGQQNFSGVNLEKLKYNAFYRSYNFYLDKFPPGFDGLPGFTQIIESIQEKNADNTPLKEIEKIKSISNITDGDRDIPDTSIVSSCE
jgi:hypothetical protein